MYLLLWPLTALLAWLAYRACIHHPRRWRSPRAGGLCALAVFAAAWALATIMQTPEAALFSALTFAMLWLAVVPLLATYWRRRETGDGA